MAKLPSTIYAKLQATQKELWRSGLTNGTMSLADVYSEFMDAGYRISTANKWLLNWAVSMRVKFEYDTGSKNYRVRFGDWRGEDLGPKDMLDGGKVWLPCKEVWIKNRSGKDVCMRV